MSHKEKNTILITGGAKRIGREICLFFARKNFNIIIHCHHSYNKALALKNNIIDLGAECIVVKSDLTEPSCAKQIFTAIKKQNWLVNILVNNASKFENDYPDNFCTKQLHSHMAINLQAPLLLSKEFGMQKNLSKLSLNKTIVNILDQRLYNLKPDFFSYTLSKSALATATHSMAQFYAKNNITVNAIAPGPVMVSKRQSNQQWQKLIDSLPLSNHPCPEDIAKAINFLFEQASLSGQIITIDGGQSIKYEDSPE